MTLVSDISTVSAQKNVMMFKEIEDWKVKQANYHDYRTKMDRESSKHLQGLDFALNQKMESSSNRMEDAIAKVRQFNQVLLFFLCYCYYYAIVVIIIIIIITTNMMCYRYFVRCLSCTLYFSPYSLFPPLPILCDR